MRLPVQLCTAPEITGEDPCLRVARYRWSLADGRVIYLCNHHADPFVTPGYGRLERVKRP